MDALKEAYDSWLGFRADVERSVLNGPSDFSPLGKISVKSTDTDQLMAQAGQRLFPNSMKEFQRSERQQFA